MLISYAISDFTAAQHETQRIGKENIVQPTPIGLIWFQPRTVAVVAIASLFPLLTSTIDSFYTTELLHNNNHLQRVISWLHNNNHLRFSSNMQLRHRFRRRETLTRRRKVAEIVNHLLIALRVWKNFSKQFFIHSSKDFFFFFSPQKQHKNKQLRVRVSPCMTWAPNSFFAQIIKNLFIEISLFLIKLGDDIFLTNSRHPIMIVDNGFSYNRQSRKHFFRHGELSV